MLNILELKSLTKRYRSKNIDIEVVSNLNFTLEQGELASIIGHSGSGKSTILHIAALLDKADSGKVIIEGQDTSNLSLSSLAQIRKNKLSFIYQFHYLMPDFTLLENIEIISKLKYNKIDKAKIFYLLGEFGLEDKINNLPSELSGGQQQRVAILRALIEKPKIIMADEPTGNLDPETTNKIMDLFISKCKENNIAALIVTHNLDIAKKMDKIYKVENKSLNQVI